MHRSRVTHKYCEVPYLTMTHVEVSENHQGGVKEDDTFESEARLYESDDHNGFALVKKYLDKIHKDLPALYQYPRKRVTATDKIWYERRPLGINKLGSLIKVISSGAELSRIYTNHSVRATCITLLSKANVPSRHIMAISGTRAEVLCSITTKGHHSPNFTHVHQ